MFRGRRYGRRVPGTLALLLLLLPTFASGCGEEPRETPTGPTTERRRPRATPPAPSAASDAGLVAARRAFDEGRFLEARARVRALVERRDSLAARALWWALTREPLYFQIPLCSAIRRVTVSADGGTIAAFCASDPAIYLVAPRTAEVRTLTGHEAPVTAIDFAPDGRQLLSADQAGTLRLWDVATREGHVIARHPGGVRFVASRPDGRGAASGGVDGVVRLWQWDEGLSPAAALFRSFNGHNGAVTAGAFHPGGLRLATGAEDQTLRVWDIPRKRQTALFSDFSSTIRWLSFGPRGSQLAVATADGTIDVRAFPEGRSARRFRGKPNAAGPPDISRDGRLLAAPGPGGGARVWELETGQLHRHFPAPDASATSVAFVPDEARLVVGYDDGVLRCWRLAPARLLRPPAGHRAASAAVAFAPLHDLVISGGYDETIRFWRASSGEAVRVIRAHRGPVVDLDVGPAQRLLASAGHDRLIRLWSLPDGQPRGRLAGHRDRVTAVAIAPDGALIASASTDGTVRLWEAATAAAITVLREHRSEVWDLAFSPNGDRLASVGSDHSVRVWDVATGGVLWVLRGHEAAISGVAWHPDGRRLASAGDDRTIRLWDAITGLPDAVLHLDERPYWPVFTSADDPRLLVGGSAGLLRVYAPDELSTPPLTLRGHRGEVNRVAASPDGRRIATTSDDHTVRLWDATTGEPYWHATALLTGPPELHTHRGWERLDDPAASLLAQDARWRRAIETKARWADSATDGVTVCMSTKTDEVELWDRIRDLRLAKVAAPGARRVLALPCACAVLRDNSLALVHADGPSPLVFTSEGVTAIAWTADAKGEGGLLAARDGEVVIFSAGGTARVRFPAAKNITALTRTGGRLVLGFADGRVEVVEPTSPRGPSPAAPPVGAEVTRLVGGPAGTVVSGHINGRVVLRQLGRGEPLWDKTLHGAVVGLLVDNDRLYAVSELGDYLAVELAWMTAAHGELLRELRRRVPLRRDGDRIVLPSPAPEGARRR